MAGTLLALHRSTTVLRPDASRVLLRTFEPGDATRIRGILDRVLALPEADVMPLLERVYADFEERHLHLPQRFLDRYEQVSVLLPLSLAPGSLSQARKLLIGSYFLAEYALESAALFSPSMVSHPDQSGLAEGAERFVLSLRATGEGHVSSITFRQGVVHRDGRIEVEAARGLLTEPQLLVNTLYERALFTRKLSELGLQGGFVDRVMQRLGATFDLEGLRDALQAELGEMKQPGTEDVNAPLEVPSPAVGSTGQALSPTTQDGLQAQSVWLLARSNYEVQFDPQQNLSERIIFPSTPAQRNGIEDARFVRFRNDDGTFSYYATFTAYDGRVIVPELLETTDFLRFRFISLNGAGAENKGMALFPRKVDGAFAMISRQDNENIFLMRSENVHFWNERTLLVKPKYPWELVQIGNCGSPIETEAGWLVLSHGVGPMRQYCIGAFLLDLQDPSKVLGRLRTPIMTPLPGEREGYVPNVVYSCGPLLHQGNLDYPLWPGGSCQRVRERAVGGCAGGDGVVASHRGVVSGGVADASPAVWGVGDGGQQCGGRAGGAGLGCDPVCYGRFHN